MLDPTGQPTLAFNNGSTYSIGLARRVSGSWQTATIYDGNGYGFELVRDEQGRPCLVHVPLSSGGGGYEVTKSCLVGSALQASVINSAPLSLRGAGMSSTGFLQLFGLETFVSSPSLYRQDATGWMLEHLLNPWPNERPFFAVGPASQTGILVRQSDTQRRYLLRER